MIKLVKMIEVNLCLNANSSISSQYLLCHSSLAVDGRFDDTLSTCQCTHTMMDDKAWLAISLERIFFIRSMRLLTRDSYKQRLQNFYVKTKISTKFTSVNDENFKEFAYVQNYFQFSKTLQANNSIHLAQLVLVYLDYKQYLTICEVEIWSLFEISKNKPTVQSSTFSSGYSALAVDGFNQWNYHVTPSCSHTGVSSIFPAWWKIDLQKQSTIFAVSTIGRVSLSNRLKNVVITTFDNNVVPLPNEGRICGNHTDELPVYHTIRCKKWTQGRYLSIIKIVDLQPLTLCEVDIFGEEIKINDRLNIKTYIYNSYTFSILNSTTIETCSKNIESIKIYDFHMFKFEIELKGIGIKHECDRENFSLFISKEHIFVENCIFQGSYNGYFNEKDMLDKCSYYCECHGYICPEISISYLINLKIVTGEIFLLLKTNNSL